MIRENLWAVHVFQTAPLGQGNVELLYLTEADANEAVHILMDALTTDAGIVNITDYYHRQFVIRTSTITTIFAANYQSLNQFRVDAADVANTVQANYRPGFKQALTPRHS